MANRQIKIIAGLTGIVLGIGVLIYVLLDSDTSKSKKKKHEPTPKDVAVIPINKETIETPTEEKVIPTKVIDLHPIVEEKEQDPIIEQVTVSSENYNEEALLSFNEHDNYEEEYPEYFENFQESATEVEIEEVVVKPELIEPELREKSVPSMPEMPSKPNMPVMSSVPSKPQVPDMPSMPKTPKMPNVLDKEMIVNSESLIPKVTMSPRFPLKLGMTTDEVERLQVWLLRKFGAMAKVTKMFDTQTEELVIRCFDVKELDEVTYESLKIGAPLSKQKTTWQWKKKTDQKQES